MPPLLRAPDAEAACLGVLAGMGHTARDVLAAPYPAIRVVRVGGTRARILDAALIQIDVAHAAGGSKVAVLNLLESCIAGLIAAEGTTVAGAVLSAVQVLGGPQYLPEAPDGAPRYVATLIVSAHASVPQD